MNKKHVISPCVGVCSIDPQSGLCIGCLRSSSEIALQIMKEIKGRSISKKLD